MEKAVGEKAYQNNEAYERTQMQKDMIIERLREQGCRITRQRQLILDIILAEECSCCKEICSVLCGKPLYVHCNSYCFS